MRLSMPTSAFITMVVLPSSSKYRATSFVPSCPYRMTRMATGTFGDKLRADSTVLLYADSPVNLSEMKASEMKKELESYGISTKSMFDRKDFEKALAKARLDRPGKSQETTEEEGKTTSSQFSGAESEVNSEESTKEENKKSRREKWSKKWKNVTSDPKEEWDPRAASSSDNASSTEAPKNEGAGTRSTDPPSSPPTEETATKSREERYEAALEEGRAMKLSSLKKELKDRGISTTSFFEKADLIKAYANAVADGVEVKGSQRKRSSDADESYDPSYRDVTTSVFDPSALLAGKEIIIDITESIK
mmetsp:Transcript_15768/g.36313  ORF Transcript_15768/g.36313 Transcript_15768/m.36313 type:complete len:305 (-) Transcript_15768:128-1042(-)